MQTAAKHGLKNTFEFSVRLDLFNQKMSTHKTSKPLDRITSVLAFTNNTQFNKTKRNVKNETRANNNISVVLYAMLMEIISGNKNKQKTVTSYPKMRKT